MGITAGIVTLGAGYLASKQNAKQTKKDVQDITNSAQQTADALTPPVVPPAPSALQEQTDASIAMTAAANRVRRQRGAGYSSTILTSPSGTANAAPTTRKTLLGL